MNPLIKLESATRMLAEARTLDEIREIRDTARAAQEYVKAKRLGEEAEKHAASIRLEASRRMGMVLQEAKDVGELSRGAAQTQSQTATTFTLNDIGVTKDESSSMQTLARVPDAHWPVERERMVSNGVRTERRAAAEVKQPRVSHNSGNNEWYTPKEYIEAARAVMGRIDLDPASSPEANETVMAERFFTAQDDGLRQSWSGRVWMNPPYARGLIEAFAEKLVTHFEAGDVTEAIVLINNATETGWFRTLIAGASAVVFPYHRIKFYQPGGKIGAPLQAQAIIYLGGQATKFRDSFGGYGWGCWLW